ncbi:MAG: hypothetical protein QOI02_1666, partial [Actinomycetota bacterium]|nr:hypothetical protein [Actinomycetota bacterium]
AEATTERVDWRTRNYLTEYWLSEASEPGLVPEAVTIVAFR